MEKVVITFFNGTHIEAERNATTYITDTKPAFPDDLSEVVIENVIEYGDNDNRIVLENVEVIECAALDDRYWFTFREIPESETAFEKMDAQVLYTAIATDTLIED